MNTEPEVEEVTIFSEELGKYRQFSSNVYKCYRKIETLTDASYMDDYRITAGPDDTSVILLKKTNDVLCVIELIFNLTLDYIDAYMKNNY